MRSDSPNSGFDQRATSPTATTKGARVVRQVASQTTPSPSSRPEPSSHSVAGAAPMPTTHHVGRDARAVRELDRLDALAAHEARDLRAEPQVDALLAVDVADVRADRRAEPALERRRQRLDHGDGEAAPAAGGGHLQRR